MLVTHKPTYLPQDVLSTILNQRTKLMLRYKYKQQHKMSFRYVRLDLHEMLKQCNFFGEVPRGLARQGLPAGAHYRLNLLLEVIEDTRHPFALNDRSLNLDKYKKELLQDDEFHKNIDRIRSENHRFQIDDV